jgi:hypothetical protein
VRRERRRSNPPAPADKLKPQLINYVEEQQEPPAILCGGARVFVLTSKYYPFGADNRYIRQFFKDTRFFLIKSGNMENVDISMDLVSNCAFFGIV